jgi:hypothetical protein
MKAIEFYTTPEGEVTMRPIGEAERQLKETDTDFIQAFLAILREFYPEAYDALMDIYSKNSNNKRWKIQCKLPPKTKRFCPLVLK